MDSLVTRQSVMLSYDYTFLAIGLLFLLCVPTGMLLKVPRLQTGQQAETPSS
jgi:hypothetical protein